LNGPRLAGERLALRPITPADLPSIVRWRNRPEVRRNIPNQPLLTLPAQKKWYKRYLEDPSQVRFVLDAAEFGPIGVFGLTDLERDEGYARLGIVIGEPKARGKGLAREALELLLDFGFRKWKTGSPRGLHRVTAEVFDFNEPAIALYRKVGFKDEGRLRGAHWDAGKRRFSDVLVLGLLREAWLRRRSVKP